MKKLLNLLLVLVLLAVCLPMAAAASEFPIVGTDPVTQPTEAPASDVTKEDETHYSFTSVEGLKELSAGTYSVVTYAEYTGKEALMISESLTLPENLFVKAPYGAAGITVSSGAKLTVQYALQLSAPMTVKGVLENNGVVSLFPDDGQEYSDGSMCFTDGGSYQGTGEILIYSNIMDMPASAVPGLDLSSFEIVNRNNSSKYAYCWELRDVSGMVKLATPKNLEWGYNHEAYEWNESTQMSELVTKAIPGYISWQPADPNQGRALIRVYRGDTNQLCCEAEWLFGSTEPVDWHSVDDFLRCDPESGVYYFTVTSLGDYENYADSDTAVSELWVYTKPNVKTAACTDLTWNWPEATYSAPANMTNVDGYEVELWYSPDTEAQPEPIKSYWFRNTDGVYSMRVNERVLETYGTGYYHFRVRTLSNNISECYNGEWSELSEACFYDADHVHTYGAPKFVWTEDGSCTAEFACDDCDDVQSINCRVSYEGEDGKTTYTAEVEFEDKTYTDTKTVYAEDALLWGDVSGDGWVDSYDAALILKYDVMLIGDDELDLAAADVSGDGFVDSYDASLILKFDVMLIDKFPVQQ